MSQDYETEIENTEVVPPVDDVSLDEMDNEDVDSSRTEDTTDYKKAWEEERLRREKAEKKAIKLKQKLRSNSEEEDDGSSEEEASVSELVSREIKKQALISQYTQDPVQQKLIEDSLSLIVSSGDIAVDIRRAALLANEKFHTRSEKEQTAKQMSDMSMTSSANAGGEPMTVPPKKTTEVDRLAEKFTQGAPPRYRNLSNK